jgi:hypothetical protein
MKFYHNSQVLSLIYTSYVLIFFYCILEYYLIRLKWLAERVYSKIQNQINVIILKITIPIKLRIKGMVAILKEQLMSRFHF